MNVEIQPTAERIKHLGQLITFKNAFLVEFDYRLTARGQYLRAELTSPQYTITSPHFTHVDDDGRDKEETADKTTTDDENNHARTRQTGGLCVCLCLCCERLVTG